MLLTRIIIIFLCVMNMNLLIAEEVRPPSDRSISISPQAHQDRFKAMLTEANIPYKLVKYYNTEYVVWEKEKSSDVRKIENLNYTGSESSKAEIWRALGNYDKYIPYLEKGVKAGERKAMVSLGLEYVMGRNVKKNYNRAKSLYERAVKLGSPNAGVNLGLLYEYGWGVNKSYTVARGLFEKAASLGERTAMCKLAEYSRSGLGGLSKDISKAEEWETNAKKNYFDCTQIPGWGQ